MTQTLTHCCTKCKRWRGFPATSDLAFSGLALSCPDHLQIYRRPSDRTAPSMNPGRCRRESTAAVIEPVHRGRLRPSSGGWPSGALSGTGNSRLVARFSCFQIFSGFRCARSAEPERGWRCAAGRDVLWWVCRRVASGQSGGPRLITESTDSDTQSGLPVVNSRVILRRMRVPFQGGRRRPGRVTGAGARSGEDESWLLDVEL